MDNYHVGLKKLESLKHEYEEIDRNEAMTRLQVIDYLLFECLGWSKNNCAVEDCYNNTYTDYILKAPRPIVVVEAKREGKYFEVPITSNNLEYKLHSLISKNENTRDAIMQVYQYCQERGIPYAVICNGNQIGIFKAVRTDGTPPLEGKIVFFKSIDLMIENFTKLWNMLSKDAIAKNQIQLELSDESNINLPPKLSASITNYPGKKRRNEFQTEMNVLSDLVLEDLTRNDQFEIEFLKNCYCKSGALSQYSLASKAMLKARYDAIYKENDSVDYVGPAVKKGGITDDFYLESIVKRPILLLGDVGVGKTSFIKNLIKVDAEDLLKNAITIYIDLGSKATLTSSIKRFIVNDIEDQLLEIYKIDIQEKNFVRGVYHFELERFRNGIYGDIKETNPDLFLTKELEYLEELMESTEEHLKKSLDHVVKSWKRQIVIFLDNADQRSDDIQQSTFLISQELAETWQVLVYMTLRPETYIRSKKEGALTGYHPKVFTISPPRVNEVLDKRLNFALKFTTGEYQLSDLKNIRMNLSSLDSLIRVFLYSVHKNGLLYKCIDNVSNGNIREALNLVKGFFGSGHVDTEKIIKIYHEQTNYLIPLHEFLRAIIYVDNIHFDPQSSILSNLYDINTLDVKEVFLKSFILSYASNRNSAISENGFIELKKIYASLQSIGYLPEQIDVALNTCIVRNLIEMSGRVIENASFSDSDSIRTTTLGLYHLNELTYQFSYIDAIIVDTHITKEGLVFSDVSELECRISRCKEFISYLDFCWEECSFRTKIYNWKDISNHILENINKIQYKISTKV